MKRKKRFVFVILLILIVAGILVLKLRPHNQGLYKVTILPTLGENYTMVRAINDKGQVAGYSQFSNGENHLFIWDKENGIRDLGPYSGGSISINNSGQIAASINDSNGNQRAFIWDPNTGRTILPTLGGDNNITYGINNYGQIVGRSDTSSGKQHAFIWDNANGILDLTPSSKIDTIAWSINDFGQVMVSQSPNVLIKVEGGKIILSISTPLSDLCKINNKGYAVGYFRNNQTKNFDLAIWDSLTGRIDIIKSNPGFSSYISNINNSNQVIITEINQYKYLFKRNQSYIKTKNYLHDPKLGLLSLDGYIETEKDEEIGLNDINNNGWIIGTFGSEKDMDFKGVLFEPIPEKMEQMLNKKIKSK